MILDQSTHPCIIRDRFLNGNVSSIVLCIRLEDTFPFRNLSRIMHGWEWERVLYRALYQAGIRTIPQYTEEKYILDLAMLIGERRLDIEVDGERYHRAWDGELCRRDQLRSLRLIELGWDVMRFWVYQVRDDLGGCVAHVRQWIAQDSRKR